MQSRPPGIVSTRRKQKVQMMLKKNETVCDKRVNKEYSRKKSVTASAVFEFVYEDTFSSPLAPLFLFSLSLALPLPLVHKYNN